MNKRELRKSVKPVALKRIYAECDTCHALMSRYLYKKGKGLCPDCIRHIN